MEQSDQELIARYLDGDQTAFRVIFERYKNRLFNYAWRVLGNRADAEDVVSEVFLAVFEKRYRVQAQAKFSTWLYTVAHNGCMTKFRQKKNMVSLWFQQAESDTPQEWDLPDAGLTPSQQSDQKDVIAVVRAAVKKLPVEQREALILREYQGLSYDDIARVLDCSLEKVKILIFRAREGLKGTLPASFLEERYG